MDEVKCASWVTVIPENSVVNEEEMKKVYETTYFSGSGDYVVEISVTSGYAVFFREVCSLGSYFAGYDVVMAPEGSAGKIIVSGRKTYSFSVRDGRPKLEFYSPGYESGLG